MPRIYLLIHGPTTREPDPGLTPAGVQGAMFWRKQLGRMSAISEVHIGHGRRHLDTLNALGLVNHPKRHSSRVWGGASATVKFEGETASVVLLASASRVAVENDTTTADLKPAIRAKLRQLPDNALVITGPETLAMLPRPVATAPYDLFYTLGIWSGRPISVWPVVPDAG